MSKLDEIEKRELQTELELLKDILNNPDYHEDMNEGVVHVPVAPLASRVATILQELERL